MDFPIPDEAGYQVNGTAIDDALPIEFIINSIYLASQLNQKSTS